MYTTLKYRWSSIIISDFFPSLRPWVEKDLRYGPDRIVYWVASCFRSTSSASSLRRWNGSVKGGLYCKPHWQEVNESFATSANVDETWSDVMKLPEQFPQVTQVSLEMFYHFLRHLATLPLAEPLLHRWHNLTRQENFQYS